MNTFNNDAQKLLNASFVKPNLFSVGLKAKVFAVKPIFFVVGWKKLEVTWK